MHEIHNYLLYDPHTGDFTWKPRKGKGGHKQAKKAGYLHSRGYWIIEYKAKAYRAHRLAWFMTYGVWPDPEIDHRNLCKTDNRLKNLRISNRLGNNVNQGLRCDNSSGVKGVYFYKPSKRWRAQMNINGKRTHLGYFDSEIEASAAYQEAAKKHFGEFARSTT